MEKITVFIDRETLTEEELDKELEQEGNIYDGENEGLPEGTGRKFS